MKRLLWVLLVVLSFPFVGMGALRLIEPYLVPPAPINVAVAAVQLLPPGTVIENSPPEGWTHLVIKTRPVISSGAVEKLSAECQRYATFLFMTTVARVVPQRSGLFTTYALEAVALGMGTTVNGKDMVLSPETQADLGAGLNFLYRQIFKGAYNKQQEVRIVARSPTFALLDTPTLLLREGEHRDVTLRYALLVEPCTGRLDTLVWLIDREAKDPLPGEPAALAAGCIEWLSSGHVEEAPLHIDGREVLVGIPTPRAYAAERLPRGERQLPIPDNLKSSLNQERYSADEAGQIDQALRELMRIDKF